MAEVLEKVFQLEQQGYSDLEIIQILKQQGVSAKDINDALNQSKIKKTISSSTIQENLQPSIMVSENMPPSPETAAVQEPIVEKEYSKPIPPPTKYRPVEEETFQEETVPSPEQQLPITEEGYAYPTEGYSQFPAIDTEIIESMIEEIVAEKFEDFKKKSGDVPEFKQWVQRYLANLEDRLKRIEASIDQIQSLSIQKINEYGRQIKSLSSSMENVEDAFTKMVNPMFDAVKELQKIKKK